MKEFTALQSCHKLSLLLEQQGLRGSWWSGSPSSSTSHHRLLLAEQDGPGPADGGHAQVRPILVIVDHVVDAAECGSGILVNGGLQNSILYGIGLYIKDVDRKEELVLEAPTCPVCPEHWIGFRNKCYYFSEATRNWTSSQIFCSSVEARLAQFETVEELNFLKRYKGPSDHWIGLSRESSYGIWKWTDGNEHNSSFTIRGGGECAYLNDNGISSARNYTDRKWICNKVIVVHS
ncbi:PREDICTED: C-type lectin domain family 2 member F-like [Elephantulus edwardii]|uniref:C-type lectin domain family 2 member F-like n=1 Tax=Elephantulus edwardii TaxID=28737 RepID=UPI0003F0F058|nr:PREDICTED: C-type lectin domain family 2 member F-like [Elephantulus edwardii]